MARPHLPCRVHAISTGAIEPHSPFSARKTAKAAVIGRRQGGHIPRRPVPCYIPAHAGQKRVPLLYSPDVCSRQVSLLIAEFFVLLRYADAAPSPGLIPHASLRVPTYRNAALMAASHFFGSLNLPQTSACVRALCVPPTERHGWLGVSPKLKGARQMAYSKSRLAVAFGVRLPRELSSGFAKRAMATGRGSRSRWRNAGIARRTRLHPKGNRRHQRRHETPGAIIGGMPTPDDDSRCGAASFIAAIDDPDRFRRSRDVAPRRTRRAPKGGCLPRSSNPLHLYPPS